MRTAIYHPAQNRVEIFLDGIRLWSFFALTYSGAEVLAQLHHAVRFEVAV